MKRLALAAAALLTAAAAAALVGGQPGEAKTTAPPLIEGLVPGVEINPLVSVGDRLPDGHVFESIPDGISVHKQSDNVAHLYVNHELSLVPFPVGFSDTANAILAKLTFNKGQMDITAGTDVIPSTANFQRFCSNFIALTKAQGFGRPVVLTNEEATDRVNRTGTAWPPGPNSEQAATGSAPRAPPATSAPPEPDPRDQPSSRPSPPPSTSAGRPSRLSR